MSAAAYATLCRHDGHTPAHAGNGVATDTVRRCHALRFDA